MNIGDYVCRKSDIGYEDIELYKIKAIDSSST